MRNISDWSQDIRKKLRESQELEYYVSSETDQRQKNKISQRLASLITDVELGLTLLQNIAPNEPATSVSTLLLGYRFPIDYLLDEDNWEKIKKVRFYLVRRKGRQWERAVSDYLNIPEELRIFRLNSPTDIPQKIPTTIFSTRYNIYLNTLSITPVHKKQKIQFAKSGEWFAKIFNQNNSFQEIPIIIPKKLDDLAKTSSVDLQPRNNPTSTTITFSDLQEAAKAMDECLTKNNQKAEHYETRLKNIAFKVYDDSCNDFRPTEQISIEKLVHIVGLLNVGKSTLLEILLYHLAKQGNRCALVVNDVVSAVKIASLFAHQFNIPAAPILGSDRAEHLTKVYEPILSNPGEEITQGGEHPAWLWFSPVCPLLGLVEPDNHWKFGQEPCHKLYSKTPISQEDNDDDDHWEFEDSNFYSCPLYYHCPKHQIEKDIIEAKIWILTPASLIQSRVPRQGFQGKRMTFAEAIYHHSDFLFFDEADRVQVQLDQIFCPQEDLLDNSKNCFLNKIRNNNDPIYESNRGIMNVELVEKWTNAQNTADIIINRICSLLYGSEELIYWLDTNPFTGRSLFSRLIKDAFNFSPNNSLENNRKKLQNSVTQGLLSEKEKERRQEVLKKLDTFFQSPLEPNTNKPLTTIALSLLNSDNKDLVFIQIREWWKNWLKVNKIKLSDEEEIKQLERKTYLTILVTILDNRLGYLVDNLSDISRIIDLHDVSQSLVHRPPRDFLPVIPNAPVGNLLGFRYIPDRSNRKAGKLEYFRYVGVGRYLLLNFPELWSVDNIKGPHTILISGTSYVPGSPNYHLIEKPSILLVPATNNKTAGNEGIRHSEFSFSPQKNIDGSNYLFISGTLPKDREQASENMAKAICHKPGKALSFLEDLFDKLEDKAQENPEQWEDRQRILLIVNSYDEAELITNQIKSSYPRDKIDLENISCLRRDNAPKDLEGIRRGKISKAMKANEKQIIVAPLMALERGHNILNYKNIAAFGAGVFISRPMPVPDDWQITVRQLNAWALDNFSDPQFTNLSNLTQVENKFYQLALEKLHKLNLCSQRFHQLDEEERQVLCLNQFVSIWQVIGRLVRGGVPCLVHFLDLKFAPSSAEQENDKETTSLLIGIIKQLEKLLDEENTSPYQRTLATELYGAFLKALQSTEDLYYE